MGKTSIEWTRYTVNYFDGCDKVSDGCDFCYAEGTALAFQRRGFPLWKDGFKFRVHPERLELLRNRMGMCFINSMSDTHHSQAPDAVNREAFRIMGVCTYNQYQDLTKRPLRMLNFQRDYFSDGFPDNVWCGTSVESAPFYGRVELLRRVNAEIRFISFEPLLASVLKNGHLDLSGISWVITGGESKPSFRVHDSKISVVGPRPADSEWFREIRDECERQGVAFFHKQNGGTEKCGCHKSYGCRLLDGKTWDGMPKI